MGPRACLLAQASLTGQIMTKAAECFERVHPWLAGVIVEGVASPYRIQTLDPMNRRLHAEKKFERAIRRILNDSMALNGAEFGNVQLLWGDYLLIVDQRNFKQPFLEAFRKVATG